MTEATDVPTLFGSKLRQERKRIGLSQEQLAERAGLDRTYVSDVERGERNIGLRNAARLAASLNLALANLLPRAITRTGEPSWPSHSLSYRIDSAFALDCGFQVDASSVEAAAHATNAVLLALPMTLFTTIDLKSQSGIVGAVFAAELASRVGAIPNPIEKGHPDIVPIDAREATEERLRNYGVGLEVKSTLGGVAKGSGLRAGESRIEKLTSITWQAHHREVRSLMGLVWDFPLGQKSDLAHPVVTGVFFSGDLEEDDWGAISGTSGRNTKVTGMLKSGHMRMARGAVLILDSDCYIERYAACLSGSFGHLGRSYQPQAKCM